MEVYTVLLCVVLLCSYVIGLEDERSYNTTQLIQAQVGSLSFVSRLEGYPVEQHWAITQGTSFDADLTIRWILSWNTEDPQRKKRESRWRQTSGPIAARYSLCEAHRFRSDGHICNLGHEFCYTEPCLYTGWCRACYLISIRLFTWHPYVCFNWVIVLQIRCVAWKLTWEQVCVV